MRDFCLLHYLLSSDSEAMTLYKCHYSIHYFLETFNKKTKLVLYWIILNGNTSRFGSAMQLLPSDIGEYLSSFFNPFVVVLIFIFNLQLKNVFFSTVNSFVRKKVYLLTYLLFESNFSLQLSLLLNSFIRWQWLLFHLIKVRGKYKQVIKFR